MAGTWLQSDGQNVIGSDESFATCEVVTGLKEHPGSCFLVRPCSISNGQMSNSLEVDTSGLKSFALPDPQVKEGEVAEMLGAFSWRQL
jgi:hypothetical protein